jgi:hypothetical protein
MSDTTKAFIFMFLGLIVAILVLGYHKSPPASPELGKASRGESNAPSYKMDSAESYTKEMY